MKKVTIKNIKMSKLPKNNQFLFFFYLVKKGGAIRGVFGEYSGPTQQGLVHAIAVIRHAHTPLVQVCLLLQQGAWEPNMDGKDYNEIKTWIHTD